MSETVLVGQMALSVGARSNFGFRPDTWARSAAQCTGLGHAPSVLNALDDARSVREQFTRR